MNNKINENLSEMLFNRDERLLDYITNLQVEINKYIAESTEWESKCYDLQEENAKLKVNNKLNDFYDKKYFAKKLYFLLSDFMFLSFDEQLVFLDDFKKECE